MEVSKTAEIPTDHAERALYVATGAVELGGTRFEAGKMLVLAPGKSRVRAVERSTVMVLGGEPIGQQFLYWKFVSSSKERLAQAAADWRAGRMKLPDADDQEAFPLPDGAMLPGSSTFVR